MKLRKPKGSGFIAGFPPVHIFVLMVLLFSAAVSSPVVWSQTETASSDADSSSISSPAPKSLTDEQLKAIEETFVSIDEEIAIAEELKSRVSDTQVLDQDVLQVRVVALLTDALEKAMSLTKKLANNREEGYSVDNQVLQVSQYLQSLPEAIKNYSPEPGKSVQRIDPSLAPQEQAIIDDQVFIQADHFDDSSWAIYRSMTAAELIGLDTSSQRIYLLERVENLLSNALILLDMSIRDVSNMRAAARALPEDLEVAAKLRIAESRVDGIVKVIENNLLLFSELGMSTSFYRQQILTATGKVSADVFDLDVLSGLLTGWLADLRDALKVKGPDFIFQFLVFVLILFVFYKLANLSKRLVNTALDHAKIKTSQLARRMITAAAGNLVLVIGFLVALSQIGVQLGPVLAGLGIVGFIIGFALQDSLSNFASGVLILIYRPYDVGDVVSASGVSGRVHQMSLVNTTILTLDNQTIIIPNNKIWQDVIKNLTYQTERRVDLVFGITYDQDIDVVEKVIHKVLADEERVLDEPEPNVRVHELGDSSVNLIVRPWVKTDDYWDVYWDLTKKIKQAFDAAGIVIPFPQRDVHLFNEADADPSGSETILDAPAKNT